MNRVRRLLVAVVVSFAFVARPARAETLEEQVNRAIDRGVAAVRKCFGEDGAGATNDHEAYPEGDTALLLYTLIKSGVPVDDPQVKKACEWLADRRPSKIYSAAACILAFDALHDPKLDATIRALADWIEQRIKPGERRWGYPDGETDLSNTQFAALGLWTAERHGKKTSPDIWAALLRGVGELQKKDGAFSYRSYYDQTGAMTAAGMFVLELATSRLSDHQRRFAEEMKRAKSQMELGWAWFDRGLVVDGNPHGPRGKHTDWTEYYLYGVERLATIARRDRIAGVDWYEAGARHLVSSQSDDGLWRGYATNTCFALLFLRRATLTALDGTRSPLAGKGVEKAEAPTRPRNDVRWIRRWLLLGAVPNPDDAFIDAPPFSADVAPTEGGVYGRWKWTASESRERWTRLPDRAHPVEGSVTWAFTYVQASMDCDAVLWLGHDDAVRVFLDGADVFTHHFHQMSEWDSHSVRVHLTKGAHRLLCEVENWGGPSSICLRIAHPDGTPCPELLPTLRADGTDLDDAARVQPGFFELGTLLERLPRDARLNLSFAADDHLDRLAFDGDGYGFPCWAPSPDEAGSEKPSPGATGMLGLHPEAPDRPSTAYWRVQVPTRRCVLRVRASNPIVEPGTHDALLRLGVFDGKLKWALSEVVGPIKKVESANWKWFEADLAPWAGKDVLLLVQAADGGTRSWWGEALWIDEIAVVPK